MNLGATAIGTGINAPAGYAETVVPLLAQISGVPVVSAAHLVEATQDAGAFVQVSGVLKRVACKLSKTCHDLRLLSSGPQAGFGDILLPPRQAGSSIMPGKVNPVIPEVMNQVAFEVIGNDVTITMAAEVGPAAAQCLRADHGLVAAQERAPPAPGLPDAARELRRRHPGQPRTAAHGGSPNR